VNVLNEPRRALRVEPMNGTDRRHDIVVAWKLVEPAIVLQVSHDKRSRYAIPLIDGSADRCEERVSIDAVDVRLRVDLPDGSADIPGATTQIQRANGLAARKRNRQRDQLEVFGLRGALLGPPQLQQFVDVAMNSRVDLDLAYRRGLHLVLLLVRSDL
jgi:hypothetical protein